MKVAKRVGKLVSLLAVALAMIWGLSTVFAGAGDVPDHDKILSVNDDGTYTIALNVKGDSEKQIQKVNVIVIVDRSGSMDSQSGTGAYRPTNSDGTNLYGLIDGEYVALERRTSGWGPGQTITFWYNGEQYTGQRYYYDSTATRLQATQQAVNGLADTLLSYNGKDGNPNDTVEMALVSFSTNARTDVAETTSTSTYESAVNALTQGGGTNWEAALQQADRINFGDSDPTYVIFFSDGAPTFHSTDGGYGNWNQGYGVYGTGGETEPNMERSYTQATDDAASLATKVGVNNFYTIFAYGGSTGATYMTNLTSAAGAPAANNYSASDSAELNAAFAEILSNIEMAGIGAVSMTDGTTSSVTTTTGEISNLLTVDTSSYKYYRAGGDNGNGGEKYSSSANDGLGEEWADAPEATFVNGEVKWDLSSEGVLENDVTYTVTFDCWPSQTTLDIVADIKNNPESYESLDANIKKYIDSNGNLKTNTTASLSYTDTRTGESNSEGYENPDPVATSAVEQLAISKEWENELDGQSAEPVTLTVTSDGTDHHTMTLSTDNDWTASTYISIGILRHAEDGKYTDSAGEKFEVLETGHDFTFTEPDDLAYYWEIDVPTIRPMLVDGTLTMLILKEGKYNNPNNTTEYTIGSKTYYAGDTGAASLTAVNNRRARLNLTKVVDGDDADSAQTFPFTLNVVNSKANTGSASDLNSDYYVWFSVYNGGYVDAVVSGAEKEMKDGAWTGYYYAPSSTDIVVNLKAGDNLRFLNLPTDSTYTFTEGTLPANYTFTNSDLTAGEDSTFSGAQTTTGTIESTNTDYTVTYTNTYALSDIEITKEWNDADDQDGLRPTADEFESYLVLKADGTDVTEANADKLTVTKNEDGTYTAKWTGLDRYSGGTEIAYTVEETTIDGYETEGSPAQDKDTITNTHTPEVVTISGEKTWDDAQYTTGEAAEIDDANAYTRPESITINLLADGEQVDSKTVTADDNWAWSFTGLPMYKDGEKIIYTITETTPDGYESEVSGYDVTNTPKEDEEDGTIDMTLKKTDANTGNAIDGAVFTLTGPEGEGSTSVDIEVEDGTATYTFTKPGRYTLKEKTAPEGYEEVTKDYTIVVDKNLDSIKLKESVWTWIYELIFGDETDATFDKDTNTLTVPNTPVTKDLTVKKTWEDNSDQDGKRLDEVVFQLYKNGTAVEGKTATLSGNGDEWTDTTTFKGLPAYEDGAAVTYTIKELDADGNPVAEGGSLGDYTATYGNDGLSVTNSYTPEETTVTVTKTWVGDEEWKDSVRPESITVNLKADGEAAVDTAGEAVPAATITPDENDKWTYTFTNLPKYKDGELITYAVEEAAVAGYTTSYSEDTFTITNTYEPEPTTAEFKVKKVLTVPEGLDGPAEWSYDITATPSGTAPATVEGTQAVTQDADEATFTFAEDAFKKPGTFTYTISESGTVPGVTNETGDKTVTVTVTGNADGTLTAAVTPDIQGIAATFNNTYGVTPVIVDPPVQKVIENNDDLYNKGDFTFTIKNTAAPEGMDEDAIPMPAKTTIKNQSSDELADKEGFYEFGNITFTVPGTYTYEVTESGSAPGVTNDTEATKSITFTVTDNGEGGLAVTPSSDEAVFMFTNEYNATGSVTLQATKAIDGREWKDSDSFTFELIDETGETIDTKTATASNKTVTFETIEYDLDDASKEGKQHTYTISETGTLPAGMTKSADITATVTVTDDGSGELKTSVEYTSNDTITNTYVPESVSATIDVNKSIKGYLSDDNGNADAEFKFVLYDSDENEIDTTSITTENGEGTASFDAIEYTEAGTYTYTVKETAETKAGFTYDISTYTVTVEVTDNAEEGKLEAEITYKRDDADATDITFENEFNMTSVKVDLKLDKEIEDRSDSAHDSTFTFKLYKDSVSDENLVATKEITTSGLKGSTTFENLEFTKADTYTYIVVEEDTGENGFTYDTTEHTYKIVVKNNFDVAVLEVAGEESTLSAKITNVYKAAETSLVLKAKKEINDTSNSAYDTEFTFTLKDKDGTIDTKSITGAGEVSFEEIPYEKAGTYEYTIQETAGDAKGYSYDSKAYKVTVTVKDQGGQLVATAKYDTASGEGSTDLTITNTYDPEDAKVTLEARKIVEDKSGGATAKTFKFELLEDGKAIETVTRVGGGPVTFSEITYSKVGTHNYTIREVAGTDSGYTYDTAEHPVTVEVTDEGGTLVAEVTGGDDIIITNTYEAKPAKAAIGAEKVLEGRDLKAGEFTFQLLEDGKVIAETTNKADGTIVFDEVTYEKTGTHSYTVAEEAGSDESVTYDTNQYPVSVNVTDDGEGQLKVTVSGTPVFTNTVKQAPPDEPADGTKTGDDSNLLGALLAMTLSAIGLCGTALYRRREQN